MPSERKPTIDDFAITGHRGARGHAPENTLASFEKGIQLGATMLELDIHVTKDGQLAVIHDPIMERTTSGSGLVHELTMNEIQAFDAGSWYADEFSGQRVPTLQQVIDHVKGRAHLNVEIKTGGLKPNVIVYPDIVRMLLDVLEANDLVNEVVVSAFHAPYLTELKRLRPEVRVAFLHHKPVSDLFAMVTGEGFEGVHTAMALVDEDFVAQAHAHGVKVRPWTINDADTMAQAIKLGVDGICTDYPDILQQQAKALGVTES